MHRSILPLTLLTLATLLACGGDTDDTAPFEPGPDPGPEWDHCPQASEAVGDSSWKGTLNVTQEAVFCEYPVAYELEEAMQLRSWLKVVAGSYPIATQGTDVDFYLPVCLRDAQGPLTGTEPGNAHFFQGPGMSGEEEWQMTAVQSFQEQSAFLRLNMNVALDGSEVLIDGSGEYQQGMSFERSGDDGDPHSLFAQCQFEPNTCDRFTLADGDSLALDQYHWIGPAQGGFAAITEARGRLYGEDFTLSDPSQLFMTYIGHAFDRNGLIFFDEPIGEACGLRIEPVTECYECSPVWTADCDGQPLQELTVLEEVHEYRQGPCPVE